MADVLDTRAEAGAALNAGNILDFLQILLDNICGRDRYKSVDLRRHFQGASDAAIIMGDHAWDSKRYGATLLESLCARPEIQTIRKADRKLTLRFSDDLIAGFGERLEAGEPAGLEADDLLAGQHYIVDFCDPNATKALHIGHLRNVTIGHATASLLGAAGARVTRQTLTCDFGHNVCETMAGYEMFHAGTDPFTVGVKPDVFVGRCYADYVRSLDAVPYDPSDPDAPIARELEARDDLALELQRRWLRGDDAVLDLWRRIRSWVLAGQDQTLRRLGISMDQTLLESDIFGDIGRLVEEGLRRGLFKRMPDGAVIYETGREEYQHLPLLRPDGFPTEHMRLIAVWAKEAAECAAIDGGIHVVGDEWQPTSEYYRVILPHLAANSYYENWHRILYAMVTLQGSKMKSSDGEAILIDEMLDYLDGSDGIARLVTGTDLKREDLTRIVAMGYFLGRAANKLIPFSWHRFSDGKQNPGWILARAWSTAHRDLHGCETRAEPDPLDAAYRFFVLQSQRFRGCLQCAAETHSYSPVMRYLFNLSKTYLEVPRRSAVDRIMLTLLGTGMASLGLLPAQAGLSRGALPSA